MNVTCVALRYGQMGDRVVIAAARERMRGCARNASLAGSAIPTKQEIVRCWQQTRNTATSVRAVKAVIPGPVHGRLHDLNSNLKEPRIFVNDVLNWRFDAAGRQRPPALSSFHVRHGRLLDVAGREEFHRERRFRPDLFVWGVARARTWCGPI